MANTCEDLHRWSHSRQRHHFPFTPADIPRNGIYILFEMGEAGHGGDRVVRIGTHTGQDQLRSRLKQHFLVPNKDRSIFRKNVGRALLHRDGDPFLRDWERDLTTGASKAVYGSALDRNKQQQVEQQVSDYIQRGFSFAVIEVNEKSERLRLESRMISTVSRCPECRPSAAWLGLHSPKQKIRDSGLWLVNELYKEPLSSGEMAALQAL